MYFHSSSALPTTLIVVFRWHKASRLVSFCDLEKSSRNMLACTKSKYAPHTVTSWLN